MNDITKTNDPKNLSDNEKVKVSTELINKLGSSPHECVEITVSVLCVQLKAVSELAAECPDYDGTYGAFVDEIIKHISDVKAKGQKIINKRRN